LNRIVKWNILRAYESQSQTPRPLAYAEDPLYKELRLSVGKIEKELGKELRKKLRKKLGKELV
jgi:hypothetical protein